MLTTLIFIGGLIHFGTLLGSAQVPKVLKFGSVLPTLDPFFRQWVLVAGGYILLNIVAFGLISISLTQEMASGSPLARAICGYISVFWGVRLVIQLRYFDAKPYLTSQFLKVGYHGLTAIFVYQTLVYGYAAIHTA